MSKNISHLSSRKGLDNNLFESIVELGATAEPSDNKAEKLALAKSFLVGEATVHGTASFYDFIEGDNANKKAYVCNGSACLCAGSQTAVSQTLESAFGKNHIGHVTCLGRCHENAAFQIAGINYSGNDINQLDNIMQETNFPSSENLAVRCSLTKPILTEEIKGISAYYQLLTQLIEQHSTEQVFQTLTDSGLRGRGGAGFPTAFKWKACANEDSAEKYIVCNADEGDPGAFTDRYLLEQNPHHILFGMLVAAWLTESKWGVLYIRDEYPESINACEQAISQLRTTGILEKLSFKFKIIRGAGAYICGEETALLRSIEGQRPIVSVRPPFPTQQGLFNQPTIINNVETFASLHWILENGAEAFKAVGTEKSSGSKLLSLDSSFNQPGVVEIAMGTPLKTVVEEFGGGFSKSIKALQIGGPLGGLVPLSKIFDLTVDFESFAEQGFLLGHAGIVGIPDSMPLINYLHHLFEFTATESCGKCFPCRLGATRGQEMLNNAITKQSKINRSLLEDLLETLELGSLCALGGGIPLPIKNALQWFEDELTPFFEEENR